MVTADEVRELLDKRPELEPAVEAVLEPEPPFSFEDIGVDSGAFGELVSRGVVEKGESGYRVSDRDAVVRGLTGKVTDGSESNLGNFDRISLPVTQVKLGCLVGALALVVAFRLVPLPTVYHEGHVVLSSNDPYAYRYLVERLLTNPDVTPSNLGFGISRGEPLLVTSLWLATLAIGGTKTAAGHVMAWYPIASAIVTALLVYATAVVITEDRRIGLASIVMLAVIPAHALRTSFGFADHHPFDYAWLGLSLLAIVVIARDARRWDPLPPIRTVVASVTLALAVTGQTLAWDNSPIVLAAIGVYLGLDGLRSVHGDARPHRTIGPVVIGLTIGAVLTWIAHDSLGWHTTLVASAPALMTIGGIGVLVGAEVIDRLPLPNIGGVDSSPTVLLILEGLGVGIGVLALRSLQPTFWTRLTTSVQARLLAQRNIAEVQGLFSDAGGWLLLLGFALFLGVPYLLWASARARDEGRWLPPVAFGWYFLILAIIQVRFVGELAVPLALFTGVGLVHLAERIDAARPPTPFTRVSPPELRLPDRRQFLSLALLFLLVGSLGIVQVPVKTSQVTVPNAQSEAAFWMAEYNGTHDMEWPSNYVFSEWGWNRMYNYFVSGHSRSYGYAQANFQRFVESTDPVAWYERLGTRRGFIVTTPEVVGQPRQIGTRLHRYNGAGSGTTEALGHYRLVHVTGDGDYKVFTVVPGAVIQGTETPNRMVTASAEVTVQSISFTYQRTATANPNGQYSIRVAQPGTYHVPGGSVNVTTSAVRNGTTVAVG